MALKLKQTYSFARARAYATRLSAATNYVRAAEIEERRAAIEEELLELYEIVM